MAIAKRWDGSDWAPVGLKVFDGSDWSERIKVWNGSEWALVGGSPSGPVVGWAFSTEADPVLKRPSGVRNGDLILWLGHVDDIPGYGFVGSDGHMTYKFASSEPAEYRVNTNGEDGLYSLLLFLRGVSPNQDTWISIEEETLESVSGEVQVLPLPYAGAVLFTMMVLTRGEIFETGGEPPKLPPMEVGLPEGTEEIGTFRSEFDLEILPGLSMRFQQSMLFAIEDDPGTDARTIALPEGDITFYVMGILMPWAGERTPVAYRIDTPGEFKQVLPTWFNPGSDFVDVVACGAGASGGGVVSAGAPGDLTAINLPNGTVEIAPGGIGGARAVGAQGGTPGQSAGSVTHKGVEYQGGTGGAGSVSAPGQPGTAPGAGGGGGGTLGLGGMGGGAGQWNATTFHPESGAVTGHIGAGGPTDTGVAGHGGKGADGGVWITAYPAEQADE